MTIQVFEVSTVPAPEYFLWFFYEGCASRNGLVDDFIDLLFRLNIVGQCFTRFELMDRGA